jgi:hypothetical protein
VGKKEVQYINDAITKLSHIDDVKVTYTNGFHVNTALTKSDRINVDENCLMQDYDNFFRAA